MHDQHDHHNHAIGIFDSGAGGLTVMKQISRLLPNENIVYFGDTARIPYGGKSPETIIRYSIENTIFLMEHQIKVLVVACNTAAAHALDRLQGIFRIPVISTIAPGAEKAVQTTRNGKIAVLGTRGTIASGAYQKEIKQRLPDATVFGVPCPMLVPIVEENFILHPTAKMIVQHYLEEVHQYGADTLVLGCTHYPLLRSLFEEIIDGSMTIVDPAEACAETVDTLLSASQMCKKASSPDYKYFVSDDPERFRLVGKGFSGMALDHVLLAGKGFY